MLKFVIAIQILVIYHKRVGKEAEVPTDIV